MIARIRAVTADFLLAGGMALLAGATDVYGLDRLRDIFVSFMSGNTTLLGRALGVALGRSSGRSLGGDLGAIDFGHAGELAGIIGLFVLGAAVGTAVAERAGRYRTVIVMGLVTVMLWAATAWPQAQVPFWVGAMGVMNAAFSQVGPASVSLTYVTGTLVKFGQGLGKCLSGKGFDWSWMLQGLMWLCLLTGAISATLIQARLGDAATWPLPALAALLTLGAWARTIARLNADSRTERAG